MKLDIKGDALKGSQGKLVIAIVVVAVLALGYVVYSQFFAGGSDLSSQAPMDPAMMAPGGPGGPAPGAPPGPAPGAPPSGPAPGAPPAGTAPAAPGAPPSGPAPSGPSAPAAAPPSSAPAPSAPAASPTPGAPAVQPGGPAPKPGALKPGAKPAVPAAKQPAMRSMTVFGHVAVSYPPSWGLDLKSSGDAAVFTDGKAYFGVYAPDPKANNAKAIADAALKRFAKGAKATAQAGEKIAGQDAYWYAVNSPNGTTRIIGIDAPTRIVVVAYVKGGQFAAYRDTFNKMQAGLSFK